MKTLIVYAHPCPGSFNHAVLETIQAELASAQIEHRVIDLYAEGFDPRLSLEDWSGYEDTSCNTDRVKSHVEHLAWCDSLIFVYPTWWFSQPAALKGWLDRVLVPGVAFTMPTDDDPSFGRTLTHITHLGVFTTCGASWWLTKYVGSPGKRILMRGLKGLCHPKVKTAFAAHYLMDSSTPASRARHLNKVKRKMATFIGKPARAQSQASYEQDLEQTA